MSREGRLKPGYKAFFVPVLLSLYVSVTRSATHSRHLLSYLWPNIHVQALCQAFSHGSRMLDLSHYVRPIACT